jgi:hypothetical protein
LNIKNIYNLVSKIINMPVNALLMRVFGSVNKKIDHRFLAYRLGLLTEKKLLKCLAATNLGGLFARLELMKHPCQTSGFFLEETSNLYLGEKNRIISEARKVMSGNISLLGCKCQIDNIINWHLDYKSNLSWPYLFFSEIDTLDLDRTSDVKIPWEISRLQWIIPVVQAWILTKDEVYSEYVKDIIKDWISHNAYATGVNWACTMEPSMRVFTWVWIYQALSKSEAWDDAEFKLLFLKNLYLHLLFVRRYIEITDINGNHLLTNCAALVVGGVFFDEGSQPKNWEKIGLAILDNEIINQVYDDGIDFEGSIPYHRFATELFFFPAVYCEANSKEIPRFYKNRVVKMAEYIKSYTKPDGTAPVFGDADDARVLPLGDQDINDHRYLYNLINSVWSEEKLTYDLGDNSSEKLWWHYEKTENTEKTVSSVEFENGGSYIMRNNNDYIFIDCGPLGLKNRGGHGHNDCLSFEAVLCGVNIFCDSGSYTYTSNYEKRNYYRSTASHNTPMISNQEINRFIDNKNIWFLHCDAEPEVIEWSDFNEYSIFQGSHTGYMRLQPPIKPIRTVLLDKINSAFVIHDEFTLTAEHSVKIPFHLDANINVTEINDCSVLLENKIMNFILEWENKDNWIMNKESYEISKSYGVKEESIRLCWKSKYGSKEPLTIYVYPENSNSDNCRMKLQEKLNDSSKK